MTCKVSGKSKRISNINGEKTEKKIFCILGLSILEWIIKVYEELMQQNGKMLKQARKNILHQFLSKRLFYNSSLKTIVQSTPPLPSQVFGKHVNSWEVKKEAWVCVWKFSNHTHAHIWNSQRINISAESFLNENSILNFEESLQYKALRLHDRSWSHKKEKRNV